MKIQALRISGFRGIPPVKGDQPSVTLDLSTPTGGARNLLLFGPNAFGKSSIASAIEWFFKERLGYSEFVEAFQDSDLVHMAVGEPGYPDTACIELVLQHKGEQCTVRKRLNRSGHRCASELGSLSAELARVKDEIVVLDHDTFHHFVCAASKDKWRTFSGLIGYELLDWFRAGMDSLSGRGLTDALGLKDLQSRLEKSRSEWQERLLDVIRPHVVGHYEYVDLDTLRNALMTGLEVLLTSLGLAAPTSVDEVTREYWSDLSRQTQPLVAYSERAGRAANLARQAMYLEPLPPSFTELLHELADAAKRLSEHKGDFDRRLLADFYRQSLQVITGNASEPGQCPLCGQRVDLAHLARDVLNKLASLDLDGVMQLQNHVERLFASATDELAKRRPVLREHALSAVRDAFAKVNDFAAVAAAIRLSSLNLDAVLYWIYCCEHLLQVMADHKARLEEERAGIENAIEGSPMADVAEKLDSLRALWRSWRELTEDQERLSADARWLSAAEDIISSLRNAARDFREELSDFSGRVADSINADVKRYYEALHPDDNVKPYLKVAINGSQRLVYLRCRYHGKDKDAASVLSESHRNSLGMAIILAFMHYRRRLGSPVEFCVFDDVTQSFDTSHRLNLLALLEDGRYPEISQQQILLLTHDRTLADIVKRAGDDGDRPGWLRIDIRSWCLRGLSLEPCKEPLKCAREYLQYGDEVAAAVYARRALEQTYRKVLEKCRVRVMYDPAPWNTTLNTYRKWISSEVEDLWEHKEGYINPGSLDFRKLFTSQRILNLTVHDSQFLDNPMTLGDVQAALDMVQELQLMFKCRSCGRSWLPTLRLVKGGVPECPGCSKPVAPAPPWLES